jgi:hypothetical protein
LTERLTPIEKGVAIVAGIVVVLVAFGVITQPHQAGPSPSAPIPTSSSIAPTPTGDFSTNGASANPSMAVVLTPSATPTPTPTPPPTPIIGTVKLPGKVALDLPGTLVASGAKVTSIVDHANHQTEYFSIQLTVGESLAISVAVDNLGACGGVNTYIAYPGTGLNDGDWTALGFGTGTFSWPVSESGLYPIKVQDCGGVKPVTYTISFRVAS